MPHIPSVLKRVIAEYPFLAGSLTLQDRSRTLTIEEACGGEFIDAALDAAARRFPMGNSRFEGQVWWFSFCNSLVVASAYAMVEFEQVPSLDIRRGQVFVRDTDVSTAGDSAGYWMGFIPGEVTSEGEGYSWSDAGADLGYSLVPVTAAFAERLGIAQAPLWAIAGDALSSAAVRCGNDSMDPYRGVRVASALVAGLASAVGSIARVPVPRFVDIVDGVVRDTDMAAVDAGEYRDDVFSAIRRASCCMIYHHPGSGKCVGCPKKKPADKDRDLVALANEL